MALKRYVFGKKIIVDLNTKHGYRVSPPPSKKNREIAKCARGLKGNFETESGKKRRDCFSTHAKTLNEHTKYPRRPRKN